MSKLIQEKESIDKARLRAEQKANSSRDKLEKLSKEVEFLRDINKSLVSNQEEWKTRMEQQQKDNTKENRIQELEEQLRDMMFFIEAQKTVQNAGGELQDGSVVVVPNAAPPPSASGPSPKRKIKSKKR